MADLNLGLSGINAAQKALNTIGNNIANAATEGYHRQRIDFTPAYSSNQGLLSFGGGVDIKSITRVVDTLLEQELFRQQSISGQVSQEFNTLRTIEHALGELTMEDAALNTAMDQFFNSLQDLSAHPSEIIWQNQTVSDAQTLAGLFRTTGNYLTSLETKLKLEADSAVDSINTLVSQIAELNGKIKTLEMGGGSANSMKDLRDQSISDLSELIGIQVQNRDYGVVDVSTGGIPLAMGASANLVETGYDANGDLGIAIVGAFNYSTDIQGGKIGGLLALKNTLVSDIHTDLDTLAETLIQQINQYHVQGVGSEGSFSSLTGWPNASEDLYDFSTVATGYTYIRVTNTSTGAITRTAIPVLQNPASDTLTEITSFINGAGVANVTASLNSSNQLTIAAASGYEFDFLPAVRSAPAAADINFNGASDPTVSSSGIYTGTSNDILTFTVSGTGSVGNDASLQLTVADSSGTVATVNIGTGYAAGDEITIGNTGIKIALTTGDLVDADSFSLDVFGNTDASGLLAATGINTFFSGSNAQDIAVRSDIIANPKRVATALGADMSDNTNALKMAAVTTQAITGLGNLTCGEFYRRIVTNLGQQLSVKQMQQNNVETMVLNLTNQKSEISGVDINDEAAQLLVFEQMFQAMAQYMRTINETMSSLMDLL